MFNSLKLFNENNKYVYYEWITGVGEQNNRAAWGEVYEEEKYLDEDVFWVQNVICRDKEISSKPNIKHPVQDKLTDFIK